MVRRGAVGARAHDHEVDLDVPLGDDRVVDVAAHLGLGAPRPQPVTDSGVHAVDRRARGTQLGDLGRRLAHPQLAQDLPRELLLHTGQRSPEGEHLLRPHVVVQRHRADSARQQLGDQAVGVLGLLPGNDLQPQLLDTGRLGRGPLQARHHQHRRGQRARCALFLVGGQQQAGEPLQRLGVVAGEIAQVGTRRHQQGADTGGGRGRAGAIEAEAEVGGGHGGRHAGQPRPRRRQAAPPSPPPPVLRRFPGASAGPERLAFQPMSPQSEHVAATLRRLGASGTVHEFDQEVPTAAAAADQLGCDVGAIANSLVFVAGDEPLLVLTSGAHRVDTRYLARTLDLPKIRRADPGQVLTATGQQVGGVARSAIPSRCVRSSTSGWRSTTRLGRGRRPPQHVSHQLRRARPAHRRNARPGRPLR